MPRCAEFYTQKQNGVSLPLHAGSLSQSSQAPTSIGSTLPQSAHRADSPLSEGAKGRCYILAPTTPHPSALTGSHLPPGEGPLGRTGSLQAGEGYFCISIRFSRSRSLHPLSRNRCCGNSPCTGEPYASPFVHTVPARSGGREFLNRKPF